MNTDPPVAKLKDDSFAGFILSLEPQRLGFLAFNLGAISYLGVNATFFGTMIPSYVAGSYVHPNVLTFLSGAVLAFATVLAAIAVKKGNLFPALLVFVLTWNILLGLFEWYQTFPLV